MGLLVSVYPFGLGPEDYNQEAICRNVLVFNSAILFLFVTISII